MDSGATAALLGVQLTDMAEAVPESLLRSERLLGCEEMIVGRRLIASTGLQS
jgi:hypothetical protein